MRLPDRQRADRPAPRRSAPRPRVLPAARRDGSARRLYRVVGSGSSFGGNSLVASFGLRQAKAVKSVTVSGPTSQTEQTFKDLPMDRAYQIVEGSSLEPRP